ncbi:putative cyclin-dependent kinase [Helianthus anomalus]
MSNMKPETTKKDTKPVLFLKISICDQFGSWVSSLKDWHVYPRWEAQNLARVVPSLGPEGVDLLWKMLKYEPADRISAKHAMDHPYFDRVYL